MKESAYKKAGVDIEAGESLVDRIKAPVARTRRKGVMNGLGGFGALFDLKETGYRDPLLVSATDGVGTKLRVAIESGRHETVGIDLVAMCVNDLLTLGAEPLFFLDYFACGALDVGHATRVIEGIAEGCVLSGCSLVGGETAEMPGMYGGGDYDLAGFAVGAVERDQVIDGSAVTEGDIILGLASSGPHSNGYSLIRRIVADNGLRYDAPAPFDGDRSLGEALLTPTRIYVRPVLNTLKKAGGNRAIKALAHITGGGLPENICRVIPDGLAAHIDAATWELPPVFRWLAAAGQLNGDDLALTFNCGLGLVAVCAPEAVDSIRALLEQEGETVFTIGRIEKAASGEPVKIFRRDEAWLGN